MTLSRLPNPRRLLFIPPVALGLLVIILMARGRDEPTPAPPREEGVLARVRQGSSGGGGGGDLAAIADRVDAYLERANHLSAGLE